LSTKNCSAYNSHPNQQSLGNAKVEQEPNKGDPTNEFNHLSSLECKRSNPLKSSSCGQPLELALLAISLFKVCADHNPTTGVAELDLISNLYDLYQTAIHLCYYGHLLLLTIALL
jgi:hypothetical protein